MQTWLAAVILAISTALAAQISSTPIGGFSGRETDIPRWCGKPYMKGSPNYPPGGMLHPPAPSPTPMLFVQLQSRHSVYDSSETSGEFIVDATISHIHGVPFKNRMAQCHTLEFDIRIEETGKLLVSKEISINSQNNLFDFNLGALKPRLSPYQITLSGGIAHEVDNQNYSATTELYYLPVKNSGSTVKIDNLYGGLLVANNATNYNFKPFLPFGFYTSCSGYLTSLSNVSRYKDLGLTAINPVCDLTDDNMTDLLDWLDEADLWYQYDMRASYLNLTEVRKQIPLVKDRSSLLSWYTADEPDGWQYALNSTGLAYNLLKEEDPYHPTGLVLNCDNYYFKQYSSGADYVMEDAYPIGINATYSRPWHTPCNETYGDCGCDDCVGELQDVSNRLDALFDYQDWIGEWQKPLWAVLQAFSGEGYWSRNPTTDETWAMMLLSFNHRAKAIMSWTFPTTPVLSKAYASFSKVATAPPVATFLLGGEPKAIVVPKHHLLDISYWVVDSQIMIGLVNLDYVGSNQNVSIELPFHARSISSQPWGTLDWILMKSSADEASIIVLQGLSALATSFVILDCEAQSCGRDDS